MADSPSRAEQISAGNLRRAYEASLDCVHCGLCLPACPTYTSTAIETDSPRGRIYLMRAVAEGRLDVEDSGLQSSLDRCLACRACESACPSGVRYGEILEDVRTEAVENSAGKPKRLLGLWLDRFVASRRGQSASMTMLAATQALRLDRLARKLPLPRGMRQSLRLMPRLPKRSERKAIRPGIYEPDSPVRADVGLFTGCMMETVFGRVNRATLRVLLANGCRVHVPASQGCCGALHIHAGLRERAKPRIDANVRAFDGELDAIILNSAGCGSAMKEYGHWYPDAAAFAGKVRDLSEFLAELGPRPMEHEIDASLCYDDACHLCHGQGVRSAPRALLAAVPGLRITELERPEDCCGSAGIYNLMQVELADSVLARKIDDVVATKAEICVSANPGCMLQIAMGLRERGSKTRVLHIAEVLDRAYGTASKTLPEAKALARR